MLSLREILDKVSRKEISPDQAEKMLKLLTIDEIGCLAKLEGNRELRKGIPEVILAEAKLQATLPKYAKPCWLTAAESSLADAQKNI